MIKSGVGFVSWAQPQKEKSEKSDNSPSSSTSGSSVVESPAKRMRASKFYNIEDSEEENRKEGEDSPTKSQAMEIVRTTERVRSAARNLLDSSETLTGTQDLYNKLKHISTPEIADSEKQIQISHTPQDSEEDMFVDENSGRKSLGSQDTQPPPSPHSLQRQLSPPVQVTPPPPLPPAPPTAEVTQVSPRPSKKKGKATQKTKHISPPRSASSNSDSDFAEDPTKKKKQKKRTLKVKVKQKKRGTAQKKSLTRKEASDSDVSIEEEDKEIEIQEPSALATTASASARTSARTSARLGSTQNKDNTALAVAAAVPVPVPVPPPAITPKPKATRPTEPTPSPLVRSGKVGKKTAPGPGVKKKLSKSQQKEILDGLKDKYAYLKDFMLVIDVPEEGGYYRVQCQKCLPKIKKLKVFFSTMQNFNRHVQNLHPTSVQAWNKLYGSKGKFLLGSKGKVKEEENSEDEEESEDEYEEESESEGKKESKVKDNQKPEQRTPSSASAVSEMQKKEMTSAIQRASSIRKQNVRTALVDFFVENFISLRVVESESFNRLLSTLNPNYTALSRRTLTRETGMRYTFFVTKLQR